MTKRKAYKEKPMFHVLLAKFIIICHVKAFSLLKG